VYNYLCWISRHRELAEDLTQETFMRVWDHMTDIRDRKAARSWVFQIARNQFLQHVRSSGTATTSLDDCGEAELPPAGGSDPALTLERETLGEAVRAAVDRLPDVCREVIVLHNLEHLSLAQTAEVLGVPIGTVKSRRARAFSALRQLLGDAKESTI
jgi:RNA polymerase sigma-70 factor (ECF subfamily)